jgi:hypothetical protein
MNPTAWRQCSEVSAEEDHTVYGEDKDDFDPDSDFDLEPEGPESQSNVPGHD